MPVKSKSQLRFLFSAEDRGELEPGTAKRWLRHTQRSLKSLPERVGDKQEKKSSFLPAPANTSPASNMVAGFGQSMLSSSPSTINKSIVTAPRPSPEVPPILGAPTAGPGTPMSGGALPSLSTLKSTARVNSQPATVKTSSIFSAIGRAATAGTNAAKSILPAAKNFMTSPLNKTPVVPRVPVNPSSASTLTGRIATNASNAAGKVRETVTPYANAATRVVTPHTTMSELGNAAEGFFKSKMDPSKANSFSGRMLRQLGQTGVGTANAGVQLATLPGRLVEGPLRTLMGGNRFGRVLGGGLSMAGAGGYAAGAGLMNPDSNMADVGSAGDPVRNLFTAATRPIGMMASSLGLKDNASTPPSAGHEGILSPFRTGYQALENISNNPDKVVDAAKAVGRGAVNAPLSLVSGVASGAAGGYTDDKQTGDRVSDSINSLKIKPDQAPNQTTDPSAGAGVPPQPVPDSSQLTQSVVNAPISSVYPEADSIVSSAASSGAKLDELSKSLQDLDRQIADLNTNPGGLTDSSLTSAREQLQAEIDAHKQELFQQGSSLTEMSKSDPAMQQRGMENLKKEMSTVDQNGNPVEPPDSFVSSMWKTMSSGKYGAMAPGLLIAGLGLGLLSMLGVFGDSSTMTGILGIVASLVGAGMMPGEVWTNLKEKIFGGGAAEQKPQDPNAPATPPPPPQGGTTPPATPTPQGGTTPPPPANTPQQPPPDMGQAAAHPLLGQFFSNGVPDFKKIGAYLSSASHQSLDQMASALAGMPSLNDYVSKQLFSKLKSAGWAASMTAEGRNAKYLLSRINPGLYQTL